jgi:hypothetical protein
MIPASHFGPRLSESLIPFSQMLKDLQVLYKLVGKGIESRFTVDTPVDAEGPLTTIRSCLLALSITPHRRFPK